MEEEKDTLQQNTEEEKPKRGKKKTEEAEAETPEETTPSIKEGKEKTFTFPLQQRSVKARTLAEAKEKIKTKE